MGMLLCVMPLGHSRVCASKDHESRRARHCYPSKTVKSTRKVLSRAAGTKGKLAMVPVLKDGKPSRTGFTAQRKTENFNWHVQDKFRIPQAIDRLTEGRSSEGVCRGHLGGTKEHRVQRLLWECFTQRRLTPLTDSVLVGGLNRIYPHPFA